MIRYRNTEIASWIIPAIYAGHIKKIIWLKPPWVDDLFAGHSSFHVGKDKTIGDIRFVLIRNLKYVKDVNYL